MFRVQLDDGSELEAFTYVAGAAFIDDWLAPSRDYLETIVRGARAHRLPEAYIGELVASAGYTKAGNSGGPV